LLRFSEAITDSKTFTENYKFYAEWFEDQFKVKTDKTSDAARACFFSYDPKLYLNKKAEKLEVKEFTTPTQPNTPKRKTSSKTEPKANKVSAPKSSNLLKPQSTGDRHGALTSAIGRFIKLGMNQEDILDIALAMNAQNDPPKPESVIISTVGDLISRYGNIEGPFWLIRNSKVEILTAKFIDFLTSKGFAKVYYDKAFIYVRINDNIAEEIIATNIKDFVLEYINSIDGDSSLYKGDIREIILNRVTKYFSDQLLSSVKPENLNIKSGDRETGYVYFDNGFVVAKKGMNLELNSYATLTGPIWKSRIIKRDFQKIDIKYEQSEYEQFIWNTVRNDEDRFLAMCSSIGYLLHGYKDKSATKAIIAVDERISDEPNGRSGKSLFGDAIGRMRKSVRIDGKNFDFKPSFTFQQIEISSEIVEFNDVEKNFKFEKLFSVITDDMAIEYKGKTPLKIPFTESPKILISTNYTIAGSGGSYEDRMFEIEFSDYYNKTFSPRDEFGHNLFDDWSDEEWNRFDNFMLECLMLYLDEGLISYKKVNLDRRKLIAETDSDFIEFIEAEFVFGFEYFKHDLFQSFKKSIGYENDYLNGCPVKAKTFTTWLRTYAKFNNKECIERRSNSSDYIKINK